MDVLGNEDPTIDGESGDGSRGVGEGLRFARGEVVGRYRIEEVIGAGGFGVVYRAEQIEGVHREVALKVIKPGMDSAAVVARFEQERQALAVMDDPHVARVYDGGVTTLAQGGVAWFAMELVKGEPITTFCDREKLSVRERLELFGQVCEGVQHAHTKMIIHRDLKPSNILVRYGADGRADVKVIDFGVAKALHQRLGEKEVVTRLGQMIGTPEYMSPEQAEMSGVDIDARTDVYSLGAVLYELLVGVPAWDVVRRRSAGDAELQRLIREVTPERPSVMLTSVGERASTIAERRGVDARGLTGELRGELDWVVMKCLEKERGRRYATVSALGADLRRYLAKQPVEARPTSAAYRLRKFVERRRGPVLAGVLVFVLLVAGVVTLTVALREAQVQRTIAVEREREAVRSEAMRQRAQRFLTGIFGYATPNELGAEATAEGMLREALRRLDAEEDAEFASAVRIAIAGSLAELGLYEDALEANERALRDLRRVEDGSRGLLIDAMELRGEVLNGLGRLDESERALREALTEAAAYHGTDAVRTLKIERGVAIVERRMGRLDAAESRYRSILSRIADVTSEESALTLASMADLVSLLEDLDRGCDALELAREAMGRAERSDAGLSNVQRIRLLHNGAQSAKSCGEMAQCIAWHVEAVDRARETMGLDHPLATIVVGACGESMRMGGRAEEAGAVLTEGIGEVETKRGKDEPTLVRLYAQRAMARLAAGDRRGGEGDLERARGIAMVHGEVRIGGASTRMLREADEMMSGDDDH